MRRSMAMMSVTAMVVQAVFVFPTLAIEPVPDAPGPIRVVRDLEAVDIGVARPLGLAYLPERGLMVVGTSEDGDAAAALVELDEGSATPTAAHTALDSVNLTADPASDGILAYDAASGELIEVSGDLSTQIAGPMRRLTLPVGPRPDAAGITIDPSTGALLILDGRSRAIIRIGRGTADDPRQAFTGSVTTMPLSVPKGRLRGLAIDPATGHTFVATANGQTLYELDARGGVVATRDLGAVGVHRPGALAFAPSGDRTDDPGALNLYLADAGTAGPNGASGAVRELKLVASRALPVTPGVTATLVQTIYTGLQPPGGPWDPVQAGEPTSPDPSGLTYRPPHDGQTQGRIIDVDGEIDEMSNYWSGANVFELTTSGDLTRSWDTSSRSGPRITNEPVGAAWDQGRNRLYIDSDDDRRVYTFDPARSGDPTALDRGDLERSFSVSFASDPEGLAYGNGELYVCDGSSEEIWVLVPGANGYFDGLPAAGGDDVLVRHFDTASLGQDDPEGCEFSTTTGTLFMISNNGDVVLEVTPTGGVVSNVDLGLPAGARPGGLTVAPGSADPSQVHIYVADRAVDNDQNGSENDGKIYEFRYSGSPPTPTPSPSPSPSPTSTSGATPSPSPSPSPTQSGGSIQRLATSTIVNAVASSQIVVAKPAGTISGDVLVACLALNGGSVSTPPAGWSLLGAATSQSNPKVYGYVRVAGASEPPAYTWTLAGSVMNGAGIARYGGVSNAQPLDGAVSVGTGVAALSGTIPGVTTSAARSMLVGCIGINSSATGVSITSPPGMSQAWDIGGKRQELADQTLPVSGATGPRTWTFSASRAWAGFLVALRD